MKTNDNGQRERRVLDAMITTPAVLAKLAAEWKGQAFASREANAIGEMCVDYHRKHGGCPGRSGVVSLLEEWSQGRDQTSVELTDRLLSDVLAEHDPARNGHGETNPSYLVAMAGEHLNAVNLARTLDNAKAAVDAGKLPKARDLLTAFSWVDVGDDGSDDFLLNEDAVAECFRHREEPDLVKYGGDTRRFFRNQLGRDCFIAFLAGEKVGKSWMLMDMALRAAMNHKRAALFVVGDMSREQIGGRILSSISRKPFKNRTGKWPMMVKWPTSIKPPNTRQRPIPPAEIEFDEVSFDKLLSNQRAWIACQHTQATQVRSQESYFKRVVRPAGTVTVANIRSTLQKWALDGWTADAVFVDYADVLAPPPGIRESLEQTNTVWRDLRGLSQEFHCLLVTATQGRREKEGCGKWAMDRRDISIDKRKLAYVTGMVGINVSAEEKEAGNRMRLNWIAAREMDYNPRQCLFVAQCLPLGNPCVLSTF